MDNVTQLPRPATETPAELYNSLGSFWTRLYEDKDFIRRLTQGISIIQEQLKIEYAEAAACLGREGIPTHSRIKHYPMVIKKSGRNTGSTVRLSFGMEPPVNIGPQPEDSEYTPNTEFVIGGLAPKAGYVAYPIVGRAPVAGLLTITDRMVSPRVCMANGIDFKIQDDSIIFREDRDPFGGLSTYFQTAVLEGDDPDTQLLLWGFDALFDDNYLEDHFGQLYNGTTDNLDYYKEVINASGDLYSDGTNILNMKLSLGRLFVTPVALESETITDVRADNHGRIHIVTPNNLYTARSEETMLDHIVEGYELTQGEFMTTTLRFYWTLNPDVFEARNGLELSQFAQDFPELHIREGTSIVGGLALSWDSIPILYHGKDANGNPQYSFVVSSDEAVNLEFWSYVFAQSEAQQVNMYDLLSDYIPSDSTAVPGSAVGMIQPAVYFMRNFLYANASALSVEFDALPQYIKELDVYQVISTVSAVYTKMFVTVKTVMTEDPIDLAESSTERLSDMPAVVLSDTAGVTGSLTYYDVNVKTRRVKK